MASEPGQKLTGTALVDWVRDWLRLYDEHPNVAFDVETTADAFRLLVELAEAERIHKGRPALPAHRPRGSRLGEMVEAEKAQSLDTTEARDAVVKETAATPRAVAQAHRRWLKRNKSKPVVRRRK